MPITTIIVDNPALFNPPCDTGSVTERICLPRKYPCLPDGACGENPCMGCNGEPGFVYIQEPGDIIQIQFKVDDLVNEDPKNPTLGWRGASGDYWIGLEVWSWDDTLLWEGDTALIAAAWHVGVGQFGGYQNISVDVDKLLALLPGLRCWYFRLKVYTRLPNYGVANGETRPPDGTVPVGWRYIDFGDNNVYEWTGTGWAVVGPHPENYWYVQDTGHWYRWVLPAGYWQGLVGPPSPDPAFEAFDYCYTHKYRMRICDEPILHFIAEQTGRDCLGYIHDLGTVIVPAGANNDFQHDFKVRGSMEIDELPIEKTITKNRRVTRVIQSIRARLRSWGLPQGVVDRIQVVLSTQDFVVNGETWEEVDSLKKNNDDGLLWYLDSKISRERCNTSTTCD